MAKTPTLKSLKLMISELLTSKPIVDRAKKLEKEIKAGMAELGKTGSENGIEVDEGRVFITESEQVTIPTALARDILGPLAEKVIVTNPKVSNEIIDAFVRAGEIKPEKYEALLAEAEKKPKISLYVRPLK